MSTINKKAISMDNNQQFKNKLINGKANSNRMAI